MVAFVGKAACKLRFPITTINASHHFSHVGEFGRMRRSSHTRTQALNSRTVCCFIGCCSNENWPFLLSFSEHINNMVFKAHQRANAILRCFVSRNITLLLRAYLIYVRPLLEYNSTIWSPHYKYDIDAV